MTAAVVAGGVGTSPDLCLVITTDTGEERAVEHLDPIDAIDLANRLRTAAVELMSFREIVSDV